MSVVSSGDYVGKLSQEEKCWLDKPTLNVTWAEIRKILFMFLKSYELLVD